MGNNRHAREDTLRRLFALPRADQLEVHRALSEYLGDEVGRDTEADKQLAERAAALGDMRVVLAELAVEDPRSLAAARNKTAARLGLDFNATRVGRAWGRWDNAKAALAGQRVPETAAQRSLRRATAGKRRGHEEYLAGVRRWLATEPSSRTALDYDDYIGEHNDALGDGAVPLVKAGAIRLALAIEWDDIVAVAEQRKTLKAAQRKRLARVETEAGPLRLVGSKAASLLLGLSAVQFRDLRTDGRFPTRVARIHGADAWLLDDIRAYAKGKHPPLRRQGELQHLLMEGRELADQLGLRQDVMHAYLKKGRYDRVPRPSGRVSGRHYWTREEFDTWSAENASAERHGSQRSR